MVGTFLSDTPVLTSLSPRWGWVGNHCLWPRGKYLKNTIRENSVPGWQLLRQQAGGGVRAHCPILGHMWWVGCWSLPC